jgi:hypothetical protein
MGYVRQQHFEIPENIDISEPAGSQLFITYDGVQRMDKAGFFCYISKESDI